MSALEVLIVPDPRLRIPAKPVDKIDQKIQDQLNQMLETMYENDGCGLAGPQVNIGQRLVVMDISTEEEDPSPVKLINPEITWISKEMQMLDDGCLSVPNYFAKTRRPAQVKYHYLDETGTLIQKEATGLEAACIHHEIDHLNGVLFIDYLSSLKRQIILKKLQKNKKQNDAP